MAVAPGPLSIDPTEKWEGNDGPWSTFFFGAGTPPQYSHVLISLTIPQPWLVVPEGCNQSDTSDCASHRGGLFFQNESSTWQGKGLYDLVYESNLGVPDKGIFGFDSVSTGLPGTTGVALEDQTVVGVTTKAIYLGLWGIGPRPTNLTSLNDPIPSMMTNLKEQNKIPSVSVGYTAGARYQFSKIAGSLTLGGYDSSRFSPNNVTFPFAGEAGRDLMVGLKSITASGLNASKSSPVSLLPQPVLSFIDAGVSHMWLPGDACELFAQAFALQYDPVRNLYIVEEDTHTALLFQNATLEFRLAAGDSSTEVVVIEFPYAAFDLELTADYPGINAKTHYFPIRRASNDSQYTLGRTFLQQAYIIADYERSNFSVHPCTFSENAQQDLQSIPPLVSAVIKPDETQTADISSRHPLIPGAIAAITIGCVVAAFITFYVVFKVLQRRRSNGWEGWPWKALNWPRRPPPKYTNSDFESKLHDAQAEVEGDLSHRVEMKGDAHHPQELTGDFEHSKELHDESVKLALPELMPPKLQQGMVRYELEADDGFSYVKTPTSMLRAPAIYPGDRKSICAEDLK